MACVSMYFVALEMKRIYSVILRRAVLRAILKSAFAIRRASLCCHFLDQIIDSSILGQCL